MNHTVYKTTNKLNNKIYIGVHSTKNINDGYIGSGTYLRKAIKKHGKENFERIILNNFDTREKALDKESELVNATFVLREDTYNLVLGGGGASLGSAKKTKEELRAIQIGFDDYKSFAEFFLEFTFAINLINYKLKKPLNEVQFLMLRSQIEDGRKIEESKLIKYQKFQSEIIRSINYVIYG